MLSYSLKFFLKVPVLNENLAFVWFGGETGIWQVK